MYAPRVQLVVTNVRSLQACRCSSYYRYLQKRVQATYKFIILNLVLFIREFYFNDTQACKMTVAVFILTANRHTTVKCITLREQYVTD